MKAVDFEGVNLRVGEGQEQYITLPSRYIHNPEMEVWNKWKPSEEELEKLNKGEHIWISQLTFGHNYQPVRVQIGEPDFEEIEKDAAIRMKKMSDQLVENANKEIEAKKKTKPIGLAEKVKPMGLKELREKLKKGENGTK